MLYLVVEWGNLVTRTGHVAIGGLSMRLNGHDLRHVDQTREEWGSA